MNFDQIIERRGTNALKWDGMKHFYASTEAIPLWVADMDFETAPVIRKALERRVAHGIYGYVDVPETFFQKASDWGTRRYGHTFDPKELIFTHGVVPSIALIMKEMVAEGEKVIIQPPVYGPFSSVPTNYQRQLMENPLIEVEGRYTIDFDGFEALAKQPDVKWFILCNPHNPVGRVWTCEELTRLASICVAHNLHVISDEIWRDLIYSGHQHIPFASISPEVAELTITMFSATKTFNIAGLQASYVHMSKNDDREKFMTALRRTDLTLPNAFAIDAVEAAFDGGEPWLIELLDYLEGNMALLEEWFKEKMPQVKFHKPEATYLAWIDFRGLNLSQSELMKRLLDAGIALNDGAWFGKQGTGFARLNAACPRPILVEALKRIENVVLLL